MRIAFVGLENLPVLARGFERHGIGGEQVQQTLLARALAQRGHEVSMIVADYGQPDGLVVDGIRLHKAHGLTEGIPVLRFVHPRLTRLWSALGRADADVYYLSCAGPQLGFVVAFAARAGRRVVFRIAHDADCDPHRLLVRFWRDRRIYEWGLRRADVVLAQTESQQQALRMHYGLDSQVASMLVEAPGALRPFAQRDVDVLWVNNLRPFKRPDRMPELARALPELRLHMIGGPLAGHGVLYERIEREAGLLPNLVFHGQLPYHATNDWYGRARLFVNTSDSEGFPNAYLQAWRRGTPVVSFFDPDGLIERQGLGWAVRKPEQMARVIARVANDPAAWHEASRRCLGYMDAHHGEDQVIAPYLGAFGVADPAGSSARRTGAAASPAQAEGCDEAALAPTLERAA
jgi:glycosyltransferase involved in cell wall biosynthesis